VQQRAAAIVKRIQGVGIEFEGFADKSLTVEKFAALKVNEAEQIIRIEICRLGVQYFAIHARGFCEIARLVKSQRILQPRVHHCPWSGCGNASTAK